MLPEADYDAVGMHSLTYDGHRAASADGCDPLAEFVLADVLQRIVDPALLEALAHSKISFRYQIWISADHAPPLRFLRYESAPLPEELLTPSSSFVLSVARP